MGARERHSPIPPMTDYVLADVVCLTLVALVLSAVLGFFLYVLAWWWLLPPSAHLVDRTLPAPFGVALMLVASVCTNDIQPSARIIVGLSGVGVSLLYLVREAVVPRVVVPSVDGAVRCHSAAMGSCCMHPVVPVAEKSKKSK